MTSPINPEASRPKPTTPPLGASGISTSGRVYSPGLRPFWLVRDTDVSGISGTGVVAEGVEFSSGVVALTWLSAWPTSVVFHDRGMDSVEAIHGHSGATRIVFERPEGAA